MVCATDFRRTPAAYAREAATEPTTRVSSPERHHEVVDHRLLMDPMAKKTAPVKAIASGNAPGAPKMNGRRGTRPHMRNALKVLRPARQGDRTSQGRPYSSVSIVRTQSV
jgi:hypothetical protein